MNKTHYASRFTWPKILVGPSDTNGGWWLRVLCLDAITISTKELDTVGVAFFGWGYDRSSPLSFIPRLYVERRGQAGILSWLICCGFYFAVQVR